MKISDADINRMAQRFYEAADLPLFMSDKPKVVAGLKAVFAALPERPSMQDQVREFHRAMGQPAPDYIQVLPEDRVPVRIELIREEFADELIPALYQGDIVETVDAAIDILYVTFGLLVEMGVDAQPLFDEVQRSNMSKLGADGKPIIAGPNDPDGIFPGRVKKGPNYFPPNLAAILDGMVRSELPWGRSR